MEQYELAFIVDADISEEAREKIVFHIQSLLTQQNANPGQLETWGKRDFTFSINKKTAGVYYLQYFSALPEYIAPLERALRIETSIMRYLVVKQKKRKVKKLYRPAPARAENAS